jgi:transcriptional regulator with XRE-family HTH domain
MTISNRIDTAMTLAGIKTQAELARLSGIPKSTIARILSTDTSTNPHALAAIARACKCSLEWLITGEASVQTTGIELTYCTHEELTLLTQFRQSTDMGKDFIKSAGKHAEKKSNIKSTN